MYYVGIDIAKDKHYICVLDEIKEFAIKPFSISSDIKGLLSLLKKLDSISLDKSNFLIGLESTGVYSENIYEFLKEYDYKVILLNSYQTSKYRDFSTIKKVKTDLIDSFVIAELLATGKYKASFISNDEYTSLKVLNRAKKSIENKIKNIKREISTAIAVANPEITEVFPNIFSKTALILLSNYPTATELKKALPEKLVKLFRKVKGNNFSLQKAKKVVNNATNSIYSGKAYKERSLMIKSNINILLLLLQEKEILEVKIKEFIDNNLDTGNNSVIQNLKTIPGVSDKTIVAVLAECGNLNRFNSIKAFLGYLGFYPTKYESGKISITGSLAKRGIPIAKQALYLAAVASIKHNKEMKKLFMDKVSNGKSKKEALIIVAKKLASIMYALFKHNTTYTPNRVFNIIPAKEIHLILYSKNNEFLKN